MFVLIVCIVLMSVCIVLMRAKIFRSRVRLKHIPVLPLVASSSRIWLPGSSAHLSEGIVEGDDRARVDGLCSVLYLVSHVLGAALKDGISPGD